MSTEGKVDVDRVVELARRAVLGSTAHHTAWEMGYPESPDGIELHDALREALGIPEDEWQVS